MCLRTDTQVCPKATDPVWSTTMTVGTASTDVGRGYDIAGGGGSVGGIEFTVSGSGYTVIQLFVTSNNGATFNLGEELANKFDDYILEVAGEILPLDSRLTTTSALP